MMAWAMRGFTLGVALLVALTSWALSAWLPWPGALLAALLLAVVIHAAVVALGFALARLLTDRGGPAGPPGWLAAMPKEIYLSLRNMYLDIPWRHRWPIRMPARARGAVLLVHGYGCNRGIWRDFDTWLAARGWIVAALDLEPPRADIDGFGAQVAAEAAALALRTGHPRVTVIAHSMGGLATRAALRMAPGAPIGHVITLGTPHRGTWHARFGRGECAAQMLPDSPWLCDLQTAETPAVASRCICIASHHDNIVCPVDRALLPGAAASLVVARVGHMALAHDAGVRAFIEERLAALHAPEAVESDAA
ncbi:esterase/lipase family protein [Pigmentiphaga kullae]|uniref:Serine aminopeptidase S33 family n=1 Tax=Pigmentiphaga kullae TaxID=151784 RepID=A0A4Q7N9Q0_9BURK|nr:alpha/beta fold hydrolase [Pigmentiphaga kullae]RZS78833.1 serine aminopeptidase S33 family [Pigmentiphaga kullae]